MRSFQLPGAGKARWRRLPVLLAGAVSLVLVASAAACGSGSGSLDYPTGKSDVVIQVSTGGGFVTPQTNLTQVPEFSLYGDGTVVVTGPQIEIYPQPALPNLQTTTISAEAMSDLLAAAKEAGLFANDVDYGQPGITDMPTTTITVNAGGKTYVSHIYALGMEPGAPGLTMEQQQARAAVNEFLGQAVVLSAFQPGEIRWESYAFTAIAVYSEPYDPSTAPDTTDVQPNQLDWPLADLSTAGEAVQPEGFRRVVVSGEDLATLRPLLDQATQITLWKSGDREYHLYFRPLLPDESA